MKSDSISGRVKQEVYGLHRFFEDWLGGTVGNTGENLKYLEQALAEDFKMISPAGNIESRATLITGFQSGWHSLPGISIQIEEVEILQEDTTSVLALYKEKQMVNNQSNTRISTVLFKKQPENLKWLFVQETLCKI